MVGTNGATGHKQTFNAKRHNRVTFNSRLIHGRVTEANLADATHGINDGDSTGGAGLYRHDTARLTDGRVATRDPVSGEWRITADTDDLDALAARQNNWIGTQAEYDALPQAQRDDATITFMVV